MSIGTKDRARYSQDISLECYFGLRILLELIQNLDSYL